MENVKRHRNNKLVTTGKKRMYLVSQSKYHTIKLSTGKLLAIEMRKSQILIKKLIY